MDCASTNLLSGALLTAFGATLGLAASWFLHFANRRRANRAHRAAIRVEIENCQRLAETYLNDNVDSPSYRMLTLAYANCLPPLLADGAIDTHGVTALIAFYTEVDAFNRGLEQTQLFRAGSADVRMQQEVGRNRIKATNIRDSAERAIAVVARD